MRVLWGVGGILVLLLIAFGLSTNRRAINPRTVLIALGIQITFAVVVLRWDAGKQTLGILAGGVRKVIDSSHEGIDFLVGPILPARGTVVAFQVLPIIVFVASLTAVLYHWNILQWVVRLLGGGLQKVLGTTKAESLNAAANVFVGQTEAPLVIRPYLHTMTRSEFFAVMVGGLSTVAGTVMVGYAALGARLDYLIAASFMAAPAGLLMAKIVMPETEHPASDTAVITREQRDHDPSNHESESTPGRESHQSTAARAATVDNGEGEKPRNVIDAAATGASDGLKLALTVGAMLFAFISLIALLNLLIGGVFGLFGVEGVTFEQILGYLFAPLMCVIGVPWQEAVAAGALVGQKLALNEFVAFADFGAAQFSPKTASIVTFALTGFANFSSLGILLGGLGGLVPSRRSWIARYGIRAVLAATLANLLNAAIAGILVV